MPEKPRKSTKPKAKPKPVGNTTPKRDNERAARALVDAVLYGDRTACEIHKITDRTLRRYREALESDEELSALFDELSTQAARLPWAQQIDLTLSGASAKLLDLIQKASNPTPETIVAVTGAVQSLAEIAMTRDMLAARLRESEPEPPPAPNAQPRPRVTN